MFDICLISFYFDLKVKKNYIKKSFKLFQLVYNDKILAKYRLNYTKSFNVLIKKIFLLNNSFKASQVK